LHSSSGCPSWGDGIKVEESGCPNLYKEQKTFVSFYNPLEMERTRMVEVNAPPLALFSAGQVFDNQPIKTLAKTPHIIIGSG